jgi:hypothetical protein
MTSMGRGCTQGFRVSGFQFFRFLVFRFSPCLCASVVGVRLARPETLRIVLTDGRELHGSWFGRGLHVVCNT